MGSALARLLSRTGHCVVVGSRDPVRAQALGGPFGRCTEIVPVESALEKADVVVNATLWEDARETLARAGRFDGRVLVDASNPEAPDGRSLAVGLTTSGAELLQEWAPDARVVKAFNHVYAPLLDEGPEFGAGRASVFLCGDDADARRTTADLARSAGFAPVDAGPLAVARLLEPAAMLMVALVRGRNRPPAGVALALLERP
jgi:predicted dinucleotide-binding enzyme